MTCVGVPLFPSLSDDDVAPRDSPPYMGTLWFSYPWLGTCMGACPSVHLRQCVTPFLLNDSGCVFFSDSVRTYVCLVNVCRRVNVFWDSECPCVHERTRVSVSVVTNGTVSDSESVYVCVNVWLCTYVLNRCS